MEGATAFVRMEQERDQLRTALEQANSECEPLCSRGASTAFMTNFALLVIRIGEKESVKKRVAELEKSLGEAQERERARDDLEKTQVDRLLALADVVGSKYFGSVPTLPFFDL